MRRLAAVLLWAAAAAQAVQAAPAAVLLVGDSTMAPQTGYGDALCARLEPAVACLNLARGGRSTLSYRAEGLWQPVLARLQAGPAGMQHFVLIQFGHNDQPGKAGRSTDLEGEFPANIAAYVDEVRGAGANAVLLTPLTRRSFRGEILIEDLVPWADATRRVASLAGVPVLELNAESSSAVARMGATEADTLAMESDFDHTHLGAKGAEFFARMVARELAAAVPALAPHDGTVAPSR